MFKFEGISLYIKPSLILKIFSFLTFSDFIIKTGTNSLIHMDKMEMHLNYMKQ